jgi:NTF2 fold immunity protein
MRVFTILVFAALVETALSQEGKPVGSAVPDSTTAVSIAEKALIHSYGNKIKSETPFTATLKEGIWTVTGDQHCGSPMCVGAPAVVQISQADAHIVAMYGPQK